MSVIKLAPSEIRFSQDSISNSFRTSTYHAGQYIGETLDEIVRNPEIADRIPNISVFNIDGIWITLDNRRLWVFQKAEELGIVCFIDVSVTDRIFYAKCTTTSDGRYVRVRGNNPGGHLWQSLQRQMIEEARQQIEIERQRRVRERLMEIKWEREMEIERQRRVRELLMEIKWEREMEIERQRRVRERSMEIERQRRVMERLMEIKRQQRERERDMEIERQQREREQQMEIERQQRERERDMEIERPRRMRKQQMEIERQRRVREQQMEIERQRRVNIRNWIIIIVVLLLFLYWATEK